MQIACLEQFAYEPEITELDHQPIWPSDLLRVDVLLDSLVVVRSGEDIVFQLHVECACESRNLKLIEILNEN